MMMIIIPFLFLAYIIFSVLIQHHILRSPTLTLKQKIVNSVLMWMIPFAWGLLVLAVSKGHGNKVITKEKRKPAPYLPEDDWPSLTGGETG
jgi:hypothetical protein